MGFVRILPREQHYQQQTHHNVWRTQGKEGNQAQGSCSPPQVLRHDCCCRRSSQGQNRIFPSSHPQVRVCQLQGRCCQSWSTSRLALKAGIKKGSLKMAKESGKGAGKFKLVKVE